LLSFLLITPSLAKVTWSVTKRWLVQWYRHAKPKCLKKALSAIHFPSYIPQEDQVKEGLKKMKVRNRREKCKDGRLWNEIVKQAKTHQEL